MDFTVVYPKIEPRPNARLLLHRIAAAGLVCGTLVCILVNLCVGGKPWCVTVAGGAVLFWVCFLYHPLVEYSLIRKLTAILSSACGYLILIDYLNEGPHWSHLVAPIVLFSLFVFTLILFFVQFKRQKHNILPLYQIALISLFVVIAAASGLFSLSFTWPMIVLASLDGALLILTLLFFRKPIREEFRKKFHTK